MDTVLYLSTNCSNRAAQLVCNDDATPPGGYGSYIEAALPAGSYYLVVDAYRSAGDFTLDLQVR